ncbi:MAG: hypothetical protein A3J24_10740 [Deltaproteobacteria bacterium RIFCSPLOWO2_02_FULL_53_8]|nr:MAG: hypothetical protein A3J24_10740 [Deltaproteobacteria bacterium RIFCSPLOWO2_02_FULL_53_8]
MSKIVLTGRVITSFGVVLGLLVWIFTAGAVMAAGEPPAAATSSYTWHVMAKSIINPHEQINDEGDILWGKCLICHTNTPDVNLEKTIKDVSLRFEDPSEVCGRCHVLKPHPAGEATSAEVMMSGFVAPNHLVVPTKIIVSNMRFALKDMQTMLPLDPKTDKIICSTCHNPHERGVLFGRADFGADAVFRSRSATADICQSCHRK